MKCQRCDNESTGILIHLCDDCFDKFEKEFYQKGTPEDITNVVDLSLVKKSAGGLAPDDKQAKIDYNDGNVRVTYE